MDFDITDPKTGQTLTVSGDSPPSEQELEQLFASARPPAPPPEEDNSELVAGQPFVPPRPIAVEPQPERPSFLNRFLNRQAPVPGAISGLIGAGGRALKMAGTFAELAHPDMETASAEEARQAFLRADQPLSTKIEDIAENPASSLGREIVSKADVWAGVTPEESTGLFTKAGKMGGEFVPIIATGPFAPLTIGLESFSEHLTGDYEAELSKGRSKEEASKTAMDKALVSGGIQGAIFAFLPAPLRKLGDKYLIDKFGETALKKFFAARVAQFGEGAALGAASRIGENVVEDRTKPFAGVGPSALGLGAFQAITPRGPTHREQIERNIMAGIQTEPYVPPEPGDIGRIPDVRRRPGRIQLELPTLEQPPEAPGDPLPPARDIAKWESLGVKFARRPDGTLKPKSSEYTPEEWKAYTDSLEAAEAKAAAAPPKPKPTPEGFSESDATKPFATKGVPNAPVTGKEEPAPQLPGVAPGQDIRPNQPQVRQGEGQSPNGGNRPEGGGNVQPEPPPQAPNQLLGQQQGLSLQKTYVVKLPPELQEAALKTDRKGFRTILPPEYTPEGLGPFQEVMGAEDIPSTLRALNKLSLDQIDRLLRRMEWRTTGSRDVLEGRIMGHLERVRKLAPLKLSELEAMSGKELDALTVDIGAYKGGNKHTKAVGIINYVKGIGEKWDNARSEIAQNQIIENAIAERKPISIKTAKAANIEQGLERRGYTANTETGMYEPGKVEDIEGVPRGTVVRQLAEDESTYNAWVKNTFDYQTRLTEAREVLAGKREPPYKDFEPGNSIKFLTQFLQDKKGDIPELAAKIQEARRKLGLEPAELPQPAPQPEAPGPEVEAAIKAEQEKEAQDKAYWEARGKKITKMYTDADEGKIPQRPELPDRDARAQFGGADVFKIQSMDRKDWEAAMARFLKQQPEGKAIVWTTGDGSTVYALTKNIGENPWRVTSFVYNREGDKLMPWGHREYKTRLEAMKEEARNAKETLQELPKPVMTEQEIQGYKKLSDLPEGTALSWYKLNPGASIGEVKNRIRGTGYMENFVFDSLTDDGRIAFTKPIETKDLDWLSIKPAEAAPAPAPAPTPEVAPAAPAKPVVDRYFVQPTGGGKWNVLPVLKDAEGKESNGEPFGTYNTKKEAAADSDKQNALIGRQKKAIARVKRAVVETDRAPDLIDWIQDHYKKGINVTSAKDYGEYVALAKKSGAAKEVLFINKPGAEAADTAMREAPGHFDSEDEFLNAIVSAGASRLEGERRAKVADEQRAQAGAFMAAIGKPTKVAISPEKLKKGNVITVDFEPLTVKRVDTENREVVLEGGKKFGIQTVRFEDESYPKQFGGKKFYVQSFKESAPENRIAVDLFGAKPETVAPRIAETVVPPKLEPKPVETEVDWEKAVVPVNPPINIEEHPVYERLRSQAIQDLGLPARARWTMDSHESQLAIDRKVLELARNDEQASKLLTVHDGIPYLANIPLIGWFRRKIIEDRLAAAEPPSPESEALRKVAQTRLLRHFVQQNDAGKWEIIPVQSFEGKEFNGDPSKTFDTEKEARELAEIWNGNLNAVEPESTPGSAPRGVDAPQEMEHDQYPPPKPGEPDLVLLGCGKEKLETSSPVKVADLYTGTLFKLRRAFAEQDTRPWMVLSAKLGVIEPSREVETYDVNIGDLTPEQLQEWKDNSRDRLIDYFRGDTEDKTVELHAGAQYTKALRDALRGTGIDVVQAIENEGIGQQLATYKAGFQRRADKFPGAEPTEDPMSSKVDRMPIASAVTFDEFRKGLLDVYPMGSKMPNGEVVSEDVIRLYHRNGVEVAIKRLHERVPQAVLDEYPDLKAAAEKLEKQGKLKDPVPLPQQLSDADLLDRAHEAAVSDPPESDEALDDMLDRITRMEPPLSDTDRTLLIRIIGNPPDYWDELLSDWRKAGGKERGYQPPKSIQEIFPGQKIIEVDPERMAHEHGEARGDIVAAYSGDKLTESKLRNVFTYEGKLYTTSGGASGEFNYAKSYELKPVPKDTPLTVYKDANLNPETGYRGWVVSYKGNKYQMGDLVIFTPRKGASAAAPKPVEQDLLAKPTPTRKPKIAEGVAPVAPENVAPKVAPKIAEGLPLGDLFSGQRARPKLAVKIGKVETPVRTLEEARQKWEKYREDYNLTVNSGNYDVHVLDSTGKTVAKIAFNGRMWDPESGKEFPKPEVKPTAISEAAAPKVVRATVEPLPNRPLTDVPIRTFSGIVRDLIESRREFQSNTINMNRSEAKLGKAKIKSKEYNDAWQAFASNYPRVHELLAGKTLESLGNESTNLNSIYTRDELAELAYKGGYLTGELIKKTIGEKSPEYQAISKASQAIYKAQRLAFPGGPAELYRNSETGGYVLARATPENPYEPKQLEFYGKDHQIQRVLLLRKGDQEQDFMPGYKSDYNKKDIAAIHEKLGSQVGNVLPERTPERAKEQGLGINATEEERGIDWVKRIIAAPAEKYDPQKNGRSHWGSVTDLINDDEVLKLQLLAREKEGKLSAEDQRYIKQTEDILKYAKLYRDTLPKRKPAADVPNEVTPELTNNPLPGFPAYEYQIREAEGTSWGSEKYPIKKYVAYFSHRTAMRPDARGWGDTPAEAYNNAMDIMFERGIKPGGKIERPPEYGPEPEEGELTTVNPAGTEPVLPAAKPELTAKEKKELASFVKRDRAVRDLTEGAVALTPEERTRYDELMAKAGQQELPIAPTAPAFESEEQARQVMEMLEDMVKAGKAKPANIERLRQAKEFLGIKDDSEPAEPTEAESGAIGRAQSAIESFVRTIVAPLRAEMAATPKSNKVHLSRIQNVLNEKLAAASTARDIFKEKVPAAELEERVKGLLLSQRDIPELKYAKRVEIPAGGMDEAKAKVAELRKLNPTWTEDDAWGYLATTDGEIKAFPPKGEPEPSGPQRYRIKGQGPQTYSLVERLPQSDAEKEIGEQPVKVKNDKTGKEETVLETDLEAVRTRTAAEREASRGLTKRELDDQLLKAGMEPSEFPDSASKRAALKRFRAKGGKARFVVVEGRYGNFDDADLARELTAARKRHPDAPPMQVVDRPDWVTLGEDGKERGIRGLWRYGRIWLNKAYLKDSADIRDTIEHELVHPLLETSSGQKVVRQAIEANLGKDKMDALVKHYGDRYLAQEEWFTGLAETNRGVWKRIVDAVREFLARFNIVKLSDEEIGRAVIRSLRKQSSKLGIPEDRFFNEYGDMEKASGEELPLGKAEQIKSAFEDYNQNLDNDYLKAVKEGNTAAAQEMVQRAAERSHLPIIDDSASEAYRVRRNIPPEETVKAYKLFRTKPGEPGKLYTLFVGADEPIPQDVWLDAISGKHAPPTKTGRAQVQSKLGALAMRPGWHGGDLPIANHIGVKNSEGKIVARRPNEVWAEVEMAADRDYQEEARQNPTRDLPEVPVDGMYRFKTNPKMVGNWIISGSMKIKRVLTEGEVNRILEDKGVAPMPWQGGELSLQRLGLTPEQARNPYKLMDTVTRDDMGNVIPLSQRFNPKSRDPRFSTTNQDGPYLAAVDRGDTEGAQRMVDEAARQAGYTTGPVFHGGSFDIKSGDKEFSEWTHFGTKSAAEERVGGSGVVDELIKSIEIHEDKDTGEWFYSLNGIDTDEPYESRSEAQEAAEQEAVTVADYAEAPDATFTRTYLAGKYVQMPDLGTWGLFDVMRNLPAKYKLTEAEREEVGRLTTHGKEGEDWRKLTDILVSKGLAGFKYINRIEDRGSQSYVVFDPTKVKSAEAIVEDDNGNTIPLSQRFNRASRDIRYATTEPLSDYERYQALTKSLKGKSLDEAQGIMRQIEEIKNRNGGMPPRPPAPKFSVTEEPLIPEEPPPPEGEGGGAAEEAPRRARHQVAGVKDLGEEYDVENVARTRQNVQRLFFNGTRPVSPENTASAWANLNALMDPEQKMDVARQLAQEAGADMAPGLARNELWNYALRMAFEDRDSSMLRTMVERNADIQTLGGSGGDTEAGRALRAALDRANGPLWASLVRLNEERATAAGRELGVGEDLFNDLVATIDSLRIPAQDLEQLILTGEVNGRPAGEVLADATPEAREAESLLDQYEKSQTEWLKPPKVLSRVRQIIKESIEGGPTAKYREQSQFVDFVSGRFQEATVPKDIADRLAFEVWKDKQARESATTMKALRAEETREQRNAESLLDQWAKEQTEWVKPERRNQVREAIRDFMKLNVDRENPDRYRPELANQLRGVGVPENIARELAFQAWNRKITMDDAKLARALEADRERVKKQAENTALSMLNKLESQQTEWLKPETKNDVGQIIREMLRPLTRAEKDEYETLSTARRSPEENARYNELRLRDLKNSLDNSSNFLIPVRDRLTEAGVPEDIAYRLARELYKERERIWSQSRLRAIERASQSTSIRSLVEALKMSPYRTQKDPQWRLDTARDWFMSNGLSRDQAESAAKMFDEQFTKAIQTASERAARKLLEGKKKRNGEPIEPRTINEVIQAIRAGLTDPNKSWPDEIAARQGYKPLTPDQHAKISELEYQLNDPNLSTAEQVEITEKIMGVLRHTGWKKDSTWRFIAGSYANSLLSGIRTLALHIFQPGVSILRDMALHGLGNIHRPRDVITGMRMLFEAAKNWVPEARFAWTRDAYTFASHEQTLMHNELKRQYEIAKDEIRNGAPGRKAIGVFRMLYAWQHFVTRALQTANQAGMMVTRDAKIALYGSKALKDAGLSTKQIAQMVDVVKEAKSIAYEDALKKFPGDTAKAAVIADEAGKQELSEFFSNVTSDSKAAEILKAAENDAYSIVGRRAPKILEKQEAFASRPLAALMEAITKLRAGSGQESLLSIFLFGFVNVPLRLSRYHMNAGPYGILRWGIDKYRKGTGQESFWKQSMANSLQQRQRLSEALLGTAMMAGGGLLAAHYHSSDDPKKKKFGVYFTGGGPKNRVLRDAWEKRGFRPYSMSVVVDGHMVTMPMTRVGQVLAPSGVVGATLDDAYWSRKEAEASGHPVQHPLAQDLAFGLGNAYHLMLGDMGIFQAGEHMVQLGRGEKNIGAAVAAQLSGAAAATVIPGKQLLNNLSEMVYGPVDKSSLEAQIAANFPVLGAVTRAAYEKAAHNVPFTQGMKQQLSINRFGDDLYDRSMYGTTAHMGIPFAIRVSDTPQNAKLYGLLVDKGAAPPELRRYVVEEKYGPLTDPQWSQFARTSGEALKKAVLESVDDLQEASPEDVRKFLTRMGSVANAEAAGALNLEPIKPKEPSLGGGGAGSEPGANIEVKAAKGPSGSAKSVSVTGKRGGLAVSGRRLGLASGRSGLRSSSGGSGGSGGGGGGGGGAPGVTRGVRGRIRSGGAGRVGGGFGRLRQLSASRSHHKLSL